MFQAALAPPHLVGTAAGSFGAHAVEFAAAALRQPLGRAVMAHHMAADAAADLAHLGRGAAARQAGAATADKTLAVKHIAGVGQTAFGCGASSQQQAEARSQQRDVKFYHDAAPKRWQGRIRRRLPEFLRHSARENSVNWQ
ncbi:hypothetical protein HMPREF9371_2263 [Neisseria shayeganii 871]|uniref:Uncharacterized protein n=1 Tax=Neisseria shayeganii 871 TaxID=1032488 RepID=G4CKX2_9NEIS|nr:hypothetical protein HMPREF9371_2263 [Neisseria shayeganii 871]